MHKAWMRMTLGLLVVPLALAGSLACSTPAKRGPTVVVNGRGPIAERVQAQVGVVDAKLSALEQLCRGEGGVIENRCLAPLHELKRKKAFYRQRTHALITNAERESAADAIAWQELEIEVEMLTSEVDAFADEVKHPS